MGDVERWKITVCPTCRRFKGGHMSCVGTMSEPHDRTPCMWVDVVPASQLAGAVEALEKIEARADPKRKLDGSAAAVALDSIYRWARKGLDRPRGQ